MSRDGIINKAKIIGIYCGDCYYHRNWNEETPNNGGLGGTETWVVELAKRLNNTYYGYKVIVFGDFDYTHYSESGVLYKPNKEFDNCTIDFYAVILMECIGNRINNIKAKRIYYAPSCEGITYGFTSEDLHLEKIHKIAYLSEWQRLNLIRRYGITDDKMFKHGCGINKYNYIDVDSYKKENSMAWTSSFSRGANLFIKMVMPKIQKVVPDFKLYLCNYAPNFGGKQEWLDDNDSVIYCGECNKKELSDLQKKSKIWVYPNYGLTSDNLFFHETFCITAVENAMAKNAIVCLGNKDGIYSTLEGYSGFIDGSIFNEYDVFYDSDLERLADKLAEETIKILTNDEHRTKLANEAYEIVKNKTWDNVVIDWLIELGSE